MAAAFFFVDGAHSAHLEASWGLRSHRGHQDARRRTSLFRQPHAIAHRSPTFPGWTGCRLVGRQRHRPCPPSSPPDPVTLVLPYAPGGSADVLGRVFAQEMQADLGQSVVIDFKPGAGGNIGYQTGSRASARRRLQRALRRQQPGHQREPEQAELDPRRTRGRWPAWPPFEPDGGVGRFAVPHGGHDVLKAARDKPGAVTYGLSGLGTSHLAGELFAAQAGVTLT